MTALVVAAGSYTFAEDLQLLDYELRDQFENIHRRSDVEASQKIVVQLSVLLGEP